MVPEIHKALHVHIGLFPQEGFTAQRYLIPGLPVRGSNRHADSQRPRRIRIGNGDDHQHSHLPRVAEIRAIHLVVITRINGSLPQPRGKLNVGVILWSRHGDRKRKPPAQADLGEEHADGLGTGNAEQLEDGISVLLQRTRNPGADGGFVGGGHSVIVARAGYNCKYFGTLLFPSCLCLCSQP